MASRSTGDSKVRLRHVEGNQTMHRSDRSQRGICESVWPLQIYSRQEARENQVGNRTEVAASRARFGAPQVAPPQHRVGLAPLP